MGLKKRGALGSYYRKGLILTLGLMGLSGLLSCTSSTGSSSSSNSSTGVGWFVTVTASANSVSASNLELAQVSAVVKDRNGTPIVKGTNVCISAARGGFLSSSGTTGTTNTILSSICAGTTNDIGLTQVTYIPATMGVSSAGSTIQVPISVGSDTVTASAMGAFGSVNIQVNP